MDTDGPDESQQLATKRSHDLLFTFPPSRECAVAGVQPMLRLPRHAIAFTSGATVAWRFRSAGPTAGRCR
jgi:hypothetical protein